jgi:hypothetical protein
MKRPRSAQEGTDVVDRLVESLEGDFERVAVCAAGVLVLPDSFYVKSLENRLS